VDAITRRFGRGSGMLIAVEELADASAVLATASDGACVFFEGHTRLCRVHRDLGEPLLPSACRHFPRICLRDARGLSIRLSHFCPTAAQLLFDTTPLAVVDAPATISLSGTAEGLDATAALPPLLRRGMLTDIDGYDAWERTALDLLDRGGADASSALAALRQVTRTVREWSPGTEALSHHVTRAMADAICEPVAIDPEADERRYALALTSVPPGLTPPLAADDYRTAVDAVASVTCDLDAPIRRYLAGTLFGNWWPYLGLDLLAVVEALEIHAAVLRIHLARHLRHADRPQQALLNAIRDTDLLMVHLSDNRHLAALIATSA
jgi:hypothetical protein